ncbi:MAG: RHS repeat-associated core domain-containing protein, partial [Acidobacteriota bacterium]
ADRLSGPAPHALYFAYEETDTAGTYEALEACYDGAGNMVALMRLHLEGCGGDPLDEAAASWTCEPAPPGHPEWSLSLDWDEVGRLERVTRIPEGLPGDPGPDADLRHVYDASDTRVIRQDLLSAEGSNEATLYISPGYEIRDAAITASGAYDGGEETRFVWAGSERIARVVDRPADGAPFSSPPYEPYVFHTVTNHLGSASVTVDGDPVTPDTAIVDAQAQLPYGTEDARVESPAHGGYRPDYELTGKEEDPDVGLMYFGARYYSQELGRWTAPDPLEVHTPGTADPCVFSYAGNDPIQLIDPQGLSLFTGRTGPVDSSSATAPDDRFDKQLGQRHFEQLRGGLLKSGETVAAQFSVGGRQKVTSDADRRTYADAVLEGLHYNEETGEVTLERAPIERARRKLGVGLGLSGKALRRFQSLTETEALLAAVARPGTRKVFIRSVKGSEIPPRLREIAIGYTTPRTWKTGASKALGAVDISILDDDPADVMEERILHEVTIHAAAMIRPQLMPVGKRGRTYFGGAHGVMHDPRSPLREHTWGDDAADRLALEVGRVKGRYHGANRSIKLEDICDWGFAIPLD